MKLVGSGNCMHRSIIYVYKRGVTVWHKCLMGENFDKFDESKLHQHTFSLSIFIIEQKNLSASTAAFILVKFMAHMRMLTI